jgi:hypothetical protein
LIFIKESSFAFGYGEAMQRIFQSLSCLILALALTPTGPVLPGPAQDRQPVKICCDNATRIEWIDVHENPAALDKNYTKLLEYILFSAPLPGTTIGLPTSASLPVAASDSMTVQVPTLPVAHLRPIPGGLQRGTDGVVRIRGSSPDTLSHLTSDATTIDNLQVEVTASVTSHRATT